MPLTFTANTITATTNSIAVNGIQYQPNASTAYTTTSTVNLAPADGGFNLYTGMTALNTGLDDDLATDDFYIFPSIPNNVLLVNLWGGAYVYNMNTNNVSTTYLAGGLAQSLVSWDNAGTATIVDRYQGTGNSFGVTAAPGIFWNITEGANCSLYPVIISNELYMRARKANLTHGTTYTTYVEATLELTGTFEKYAFVGAKAGGTYYGSGQGIDN